MQTHGGVEAEVAILAAERELIAEIKVDWNWNGLFNHPYSNLSSYADNIVVDRALTGAAPSEIMLIEGSAAAELSFVVGGENWSDGMNLVSMFSPYNGNSPFYNFKTVGAEVTYRIGVQTVIGTIWYPQFVGNIRTITPNRGGNSVTITALDRVEKLRVPINHTDWGILDLQAGQGFVSGQLTHSHWVIDHCLRHGDTSSSPYRWWTEEEKTGPTWTTQLYLSGNGSIAPNVGWVDGSYQNQFPDTDNNSALTMFQDFGQAHPNSPDASTKKPQMFRAQRNWGNDFNIFWSASKLGANAKNNYQLHFTLHTQSLAGSEWFATMPEAPIMEYQMKDERSFQVMVGLGQMWVRYFDTEQGYTFNGTKLTIPTGVGNEHVRCTAMVRGIGSSSATEQCQLKINATSTTIQNMKAGRPYNAMASDGRFRIWRKLAVQDVALTTRHNTEGIIPVPTAKYPAVLDRGLNRLSFLPNRRGALAWDVITEVAAAEFGAVFWDESGVFRFWNQDTISSKKNTISRTFTLDHVAGLEMTNSLDSVRNVYSITAKKGRVQNVVVFETTGPDEIYAPPGVWTSFRIWVDGIITPNSGQPALYKNPESNAGLPAWNDASTRFGMVTQRWVNGAWQDFIPGNAGDTWLSWMYRDYDGATVFTMWNGWGEPVRFALTGGGPALRWDGSKLTMFDDQPFSLRDPDSISKWGPQGLELAGDWYQEFYARGTFLPALLTRTSEPIPTTQAITIAGDPRLQLGDAIRVVDPEGMGEDIRLQIYGIRRTFSKDAGLVDELAVEMTRPPQIGIWDSAQYGLWNQTFYWSA